MRRFLSHLLLKALLLLTSLFAVTSFSASPQQSFLQEISSFFNKPKISSSKNDLSSKRQILKKNLLQLCNDEKKVDRGDIESLIAELQEVQAFRETATNRLLRKEWLLVWTTEKEINIFSDFNISGDITQTITSDSLENYIPFQKGGGLGVKGSIIPDESIRERTNFQFQSATLELGKFKLSIPPIGKGWFDTIYLDEDLRVDVNSRDDILICVPNTL